jgi:hypothetical protein
VQVAALLKGRVELWRDNAVHFHLLYPGLILLQNRNEASRRRRKIGTSNLEVGCFSRASPVAEFNAPSAVLLSYLPFVGSNRLKAGSSVLTWPLVILFPPTKA